MQIDPIKFLEILEQCDDEVLEQKTSWGRNILKGELQKSRSVAFAKYISSIDQSTEPAPTCSAEPDTQCDGDSNDDVPWNDSPTSVFKSRESVQQQVIDMITRKISENELFYHGMDDSCEFIIPDFCLTKIDLAKIERHYTVDRNWTKMTYKTSAESGERPGLASLRLYN